MSVSVAKLPLDRDFTRFLNDPTFPYKVTVCIGSDQILCSGVLLAQQSSVLEQKIREDSGVLMFDEMLEIKNSSEVLHQCIEFLHGADLTFTLDNIEIILKFASWYKVKDLMGEALGWIFCYFDHHSYSGDSIVVLFNLLFICYHLDEDASCNLKLILFSIIDEVGDKFYYDQSEKGSLFHVMSGLMHSDIAKIISIWKPLDNSTFFYDWLDFSIENKKFVLDNINMFKLSQIFPTENDLSNFISLISDDEELMDPRYMKILLQIQKDFLAQNTAQSTNQPAALNSDNANNSTSSCICYGSSIVSYALPSASSFWDDFSISDSDFDCDLNSDSSESYDHYKERTVWIGNVPTTAANADLNTLFGRYGKIDAIDIREAPLYSCNQAFITFATVGSAYALLRANRRFTLQGSILKIAERR